MLFNGYVFAIYFYSPRVIDESRLFERCVCAYCLMFTLKTHDRHNNYETSAFHFVCDSNGIQISALISVELKYKKRAKIIRDQCDKRRA